MIDSFGGRVWKDGGPEISYVIAPSGPAKARVYAEQNSKASLTVVESPTTGEVVVALDEDQGAMVVTVDHHVHFTARNVRSRKDAVDVILMATSASGFLK